MIYPTIKKKRGGIFTFNWISTRTGFRFGTNSIRRWIAYPFTRAAWLSRKNHRDRMKKAVQESLRRMNTETPEDWPVSPAPPLPPRRPQEVVSRQPAEQSGDSFLTSAAIAYATDNAAIGGMIGGDILGGIVGDAMNDGVVDVGSSDSSDCSSGSSD